MSNRTPCSTVFVGNIFYEVTEDMLVKLLSEVGPVKSLRLVCDRETGKPKGFGICEFFDVMTADSAVRNLNGRELSGRTLRIDFADEGTKGGPEGSGSARPGGRGQGQAGQVVGMEAATAAAVAIGGQPGDEVASVLGNMSKQELWDVLEQTKALVQQNPKQARSLLIANPALTKAIFQAQIILGIIKTQGIAPAGPPPGMPPAAPQGNLGMGGPPMGGYGGAPQHPGNGHQAMGMAHQHQPPPMGHPTGGLTVEQQEQQEQQMLLQQLMSLTPEQVELLPPEQKAMVLEFKAQLQQQG